jgi:3-oxoacyl-[acyl-carrier protein] reductase
MELVLTAIREQGGDAVAIEADLADCATPARLFDFAESAFGPADILINNASGSLTRSCPRRLTGSVALARVSTDTFDRQFAVDAIVAALIAEFARRHEARHATWAASSASPLEGRTAFRAKSHGAAKAALENYTVSAAFELASLASPRTSSTRQ